MNVQSLWAHMKALWPHWTLLPPAPFVLWGIYCFAHGERRWEIALFMLLPAVFAYTSVTTKRLLIGTYPLFLVGILYDAMRFVQNIGLTESNVHVCDLYALETRLFGVPSGHGGDIALADWFQAHASKGLDLYCAIPYGTFLYVSISYAIYLYFRSFTALQRFTWSFFILNIAAFITYHIYPAAPPWYLHTYGCVVDLTAKASEGPNLARVDAWLGAPYFASFYGRSHDIFGAMPSLHVAYPLLILLEGWRLHGWAGRMMMFVFFLSMAFSAVYLDHHWVLDVTMGICYTLFVYGAVKWYFNLRPTAEPESRMHPQAP